MFFLTRRRPIAFVNARVVTPDGIGESLRFSTTVLSLDEPSRSGDAVVDLEGAFVLPGLINAHDHLELNHYGPLKVRDRYENATGWIEDLRPALRENLEIRRNSAYPLRDRLFIGGLKNVLSGVTTVAHHNPLYSEIGRHFPVRVLRRFGWAHSFHLEGRPVGAHGEVGQRVREAFQATAAAVPFIVHAAEGVDEAAAREISRLDALGCLAANTVLVHGVAMTVEAWRQASTAGVSLVWCPASNRFLFGRTIPARAFLDATTAAPTRLCVGTDSRVTGSRDLLDELREAASAAPVTATELLRMVTTTPARVLRQPHLGRIVVGGAADLLVVPGRGEDAAAALLTTLRSEVCCVIRDGRPIVGSRRFVKAFEARGTDGVGMEVDGVARVADVRLARRVARCPIQEPGVVVRSSA